MSNVERGQPVITHTDHSLILYPAVGISLLARNTWVSILNFSNHWGRGGWDIEEGISHSPPFFYSFLCRFDFSTFSFSSFEGVAPRVDRPTRQAARNVNAIYHVRDRDKWTGAARGRIEWHGNKNPVEKARCVTSRYERVGEICRASSTRPQAGCRPPGFYTRTYDAGSRTYLDVSWEQPDLRARQKTAWANIKLNVRIPGPGSLGCTILIPDLSLRFNFFICFFFHSYLLFQYYYLNQSLDQSSNNHIRVHFINYFYFI